MNLRWALLASSAIFAFGCELVLGDLPSPAGSTGTGGSGGSTVSTTGAGGTTATTTATTTTTTTTTATTTTTGGGGSGGCCDCDGDQHPAKGPCGGDDCDDGDAKAYPGEVVYYGTANAVVGFDWNCDGTPERDPMLDHFVDCGAIGLPCAAGTGFLAKVPPPCGEAADWGTCKQSGINCIKDVLEAGRLMKCR